MGRSVSRVGGKAQSPGYRAVAGDLRLSYAQFEELEGFSRFGTELDVETRRVLRRGRRVRAVLTQGPLVTISVGEQLAVLAAVVAGAFDRVPPARVSAAEDALRRAARTEHVELLAALDEGGAWRDDDRERLVATADRIATGFLAEGEGVDGDA